MRRIHYADVSCAARALMRVPRGEQVQTCLRMIRRAGRADRYRLATGYAHPQWGTGALMEVARLHPLPPEPGFEEPEYLAALQVVLVCLRRAAVIPRRN